jgi:glycerophosphoryl diester phosphodiesterase
MSLSLPKLVAHRGYTAHYPENSLLAIAAAVNVGAEFIEFDVLMSADEVPVLFHDRDLQRMCGKQGAVHDYPLAELKTFSVSEFHRFGYKYVNNRITTLAQVVDYLAGQPQVTAFVEIKRQALQHHGVEKVLDRVLQDLKPIQQQAVVISYDLQALLALRKKSEIPVAAVFDDWRERKQALIKQLEPQYLFTNINQLPRFGKLKHTGAQLAVYECIDPQQARRVHERGIDLVETFAIGEMLHAFHLMSEPE